MATWQRLVASGSSNLQLRNDAGYITDPGNAFNTASYDGVNLLADSPSGSLNFATGSNQGLTILANAETDTLTFGLENIPNASLENSTFRIEGDGITDADVVLGSTASIDVNVDGKTIVIEEDTLKVGLNSLEVTHLSSSAVVDSSEGISLATTGSDDSVATTKAIYDFVTNQVGGATLTISGSTGGDGIDLNEEILTITGEGNVVSTEVTPNTVTISLVEGGIANSKLENDSITLGDTQIVLGTTASAITGLTNVESITLSGSLSSTSVLEDGVTATTQLAGDTTTKVATTEFVTSAVSDLSSTIAISSSDDNTNDLIDLKDEPLNFEGTTEDVDITIISGTNTVKVGLRDDVIIQNNLTVKNDLVVDGDMVVTGTASFRHETILEVADQFILMGSGSSTPQDGGIVVQQGTQDFGDLFGFDQESERWAVKTNFDSRTGAFDPEAFMATVVTGSSGENDPSAVVNARYTSAGNIFVGGDSSIWIFG